MPTIDATRPPSGSSPLVPDGTTPAVEPETALPDPLAALALSGDPGAELAALAVQSGEQQENVARAARDNQIELEIHEDALQVDAMHEKAHDILASGIWEGVGTATEGAFGVLAAVAPSSRAGDAVKAGGKVANGGALIVSTFSKAAEVTDDATAAAAKSASDQARGAADDLADAKKSGADLISAALDFYREYTSAQAAANTAALHRA
jgi:hypothetical protein